jgi:hypothetical protein
VHAQLLRDVLREFGDDPDSLALAWDEATERTVTPFYRSQREADTARFSEMTELRAGRVPEPRDGAAFALPVAAAHDPELFRAFQETVGCLATSDEVLARPGISERLERFRGQLPVQQPGPDRGRMETLLA